VSGHIFLLVKLVVTIKAKSRPAVCTELSMTIEQQGGSSESSGPAMTAHGLVKQEIVIFKIESSHCKPPVETRAKLNIVMTHKTPQFCKGQKKSDTPFPLAGMH
jgi:hypothetical protein